MEHTFTLQEVQQILLDCINEATEFDYSNTQLKSAYTLADYGIFGFRIGLLVKLLKTKLKTKAKLELTERSTIMDVLNILRKAG